MIPQLRKRKLFVVVVVGIVVVVVVVVVVTFVVVAVGVVVVVVILVVFVVGRYVWPVRPDKLPAAAPLTVASADASGNFVCRRSACSFF